MSGLFHVMESFLKEVIEGLYAQNKSFDHMAFVLPSKRAGLFLKKHISEFVRKPIFSPKIYSIEELILEISGIANTTNLNLLLELYETSKLYLKSEELTFQSFLSWGNTLLSDFNEIDRNLVEHKSLFAYLTESQRIKNWGGDKRPTPLISNSLKFWSQLETVYENFQSRLLEKGVGYQGLLYRKASEKVQSFLSNNPGITYHFIGFNALNLAEEHIFQSFFTNGKATVSWDIDSYFVEDGVHEAGFFIRNYLKKWNQFDGLPALEHSNQFLKEKKIHITGVPKSMSQAKYVGHILRGVLSQNNENNIALVLADETLLKPILHALPENTFKVNITMGLPLRKTTLFDFFDSLFNVHLNRSKNGWYHKDVIKLLSNPYTIAFLNTSKNNFAVDLKNHIKEKNILFVNQVLLDTLPYSKSARLKRLFSSSLQSAFFAKTCLTVVQDLKQLYQESNNQQEIHQLYGFHQLFTQVNDLVRTKPYLNSLKALKHIFNELVLTEKIDFKGEPLGGLQIMGVLESRNLDFETVIITSVNEGILPAGKSQNSFIPYDIKKGFGLPTYKEKDAIYAYHFYRLLQRAKNIHLLYNTEPDVLLGNEKSRFISQLQTDTSLGPYITQSVAAPETAIALEPAKEIVKTPELIGLLMELGSRGFSPSALTNYIKNPYAFYKNNVLRLNEVEEVEENIAYNTFGTIVHDTLEELYLPLVGERITPKRLESLKKDVTSITKTNFEKFYMSKDIESGQNLIAFHVIQKYVSSVIELDIERSRSHEIILMALEKSIKAQILLPGHPQPLFLKGKLDRLESVDGVVHILDYKTGNVASSEVEVLDVMETITNEKRSKAFQLLCYALMLHKEDQINSLNAGIVPIKKLTMGILPFALKKGARGPRDLTIDKELLIHFQEHLFTLLTDILNPEKPFVDTDSVPF